MKTEGDWTTLFFRNRHILWLSILVIVVAGMGAWSILPRAEDPRILNRFASVLTPYPGASALNVEALVTEPIEQQLRRTPEIKHVNSQSSPGFSFINIELKDQIIDVDTVWSRLRDYVNQVQFPKGAGPAELDDTRVYAYTKIMGFNLKQDSIENLLLARRYAKELAARLRVVKGTDKVELFGAPSEEVTVEVDPQALANFGLSMTALANKIQASDAKVAAGTLENKHHRIIVEVEGSFDLLSRLRKLPITSHQGNVLLLQDIATVNYSVDKSRSSVALNNQTRAILMAIRMQDKVIIAQWDERVNKVIEQFRQELPDSIELVELFNQSAYTHQRFEQLQRNLLIGILSIVAVLLVTLGWRAAFVVGFTLPLTMLLTLFGLQILGFSLNQMTVIGLIVAMGIMIDNAIVIAEGIQQRRLQGMSKLGAVGETVQHFWVPLFGATLTTVLAFLPIVLIPGATGEFVGGIGYSVIITLFGSYFIAHTIIASLAGYTLSGKTKSSWFQIGLRLPRAFFYFDKLLSWCLSHAKLSSLVLLGIIGLGFIARMGLTEQFFPVSGRDQIKIGVYAAPSSDLDRTHALIAKIQKVIAQESQVKNQVWSIGRSSPPFYYNIVRKQENNPSYAQAMVTLNHVRQLDSFVNRLQTRLDRRFTQAIIIVERIDQGPPFDAPLEIRIYGQDLKQLHYLGDEVRKRFARIDFLTHSRSTLGTSLPKLAIHLDEEQVHGLGLSSQGLAQQLKNYIDGVAAGELLEGTELIPVMLQLATQDKSQMSRLLELPLSLVVANERYSGLVLSAVAQFKLLPSWRSITRRDSSRVNILYGYLKAGILPEQGVRAWEKILKSTPLKLPPGYRLEVGGEKEKRDESVGKLLSHIPLILLLLFSVLLLTFRSLKYVFILLLVVLLAVGMGLLSLYLSGYPFGFQVIIGLIGLIGLAINAAIVILSEIKINPKARAGDAMEIKACVGICLRHIVSTTLTTVAGFTPLILSGGKFWPPFAYVLAGGTFLTTMISLFLVPVLYVLLSRAAKGAFDGSMKSI